MKSGGPQALVQGIENAAALLLAVLWLAPLLYAFWAAFHPPEYAIRFDLLAPLTLENFSEAWEQAPFARYFLNTFMLVTSILAVQFVLCTLAAYAFARFEFPGRDVAFALVLMQLMIMPEVLIVENYRTMSHLGLVDTILGIGLPYMASAFGIFLLRQTFKTVPKELDDAARVEGCSHMQVLWNVVYVPLRRPCPRSSTTRPASKAARTCRCCGRSTCRWRVRRTSPMALCRSATTGTTSCGRW